MRDYFPPITFRVWNTQAKAWVQSDGKQRFGVFGPLNTLTNSFSEDGLVFLRGSGLTDKSGQEIFKGDIVKTDPNHITLVLSLNTVEYTNGVVTYINSGFNICQPYVGRVNMEEYKVCDCCPCGLEIIGNIFENPDLVIEAKQV